MRGAAGKALLSLRDWSGKSYTKNSFTGIGMVPVSIELRWLTSVFREDTLSVATL